MVGPLGARHQSRQPSFIEIGPEAFGHFWRGAVVRDIAEWAWLSWRTTAAGALDVSNAIRNCPLCVMKNCPHSARLRLPCFCKHHQGVACLDVIAHFKLTNRNLHK